MPNSKHHYRKSKRRKRLQTKPVKAVPAYRLRIVFALLCAGLLGLMGRMAWLQVFQASELESRARALQTHRVKPLGKRRTIIERTGRLVALDEERYRLWAHPRYFNFPGDAPTYLRKPVEVAQKLVEPLGSSKDSLLSLLSKRSSGIKLAESLDHETASKIRRLGISGLDLEPYLQRVYPQGTLFANVVGFLNQDRIPQAGLEQSLNNDLWSQEKIRYLRKGADGTPLPDDLEFGVFSGDDVKVQLTLDSRLQDLAFNALGEAVDHWEAKKGVAIVMDVTNGEILTLASTPTYDPNTYWDYSPGLFREWSVQDLFEPGSTFKPINLALALEEGAIRIDGTVKDNGIVNIGGWPIYNHDRKANGEIDFPTVLQVSSNVGMVNAMSQLSPELYWEWLHKLGLDSKPETDLPGAVAGQLKNKQEFISQPIESAVASYGQGFSLTPLKLAQLHALIANGGYLVTPHITRRGLEGNLSTNKLDLGNQILRAEVTNVVLEWMESVVEHGSGIGVKTPGHRIGGKTGTAQKVVNGKYQPGIRICSFVASLPINNPKYVVLVVVDEPKGEGAYGSTVAVPVAKKIIDGLLVLERIPPVNNQVSLEPAKG